MDHLTTSELVARLALEADLTDRERVLLDRLTQAVDELDWVTDALTRAELRLEESRRHDHA